MRGKRLIISSNGPTVAMEMTTNSCYCCGERAGKMGALRISITKHPPALRTIIDEELEHIYLCLRCAGTISSSIIEMVTKVATET